MGQRNIIGGNIELTPTEFIITTAGGLLVGFGLGVWVTIKFRDKK